jgi:hypothetical protein
MTRGIRVLDSEPEAALSVTRTATDSADHQDPGLAWIIHGHGDPFID